MPQIFANIFHPGMKWSKKYSFRHGLKLTRDNNFFQPGWKLKISPGGEILRVTVL